jgi:uncharacterized membrane protein
MANRRLDVPVTKSLRTERDPERIGRLSERIARFIGSWRFIGWMTLVVSTWLALNIFAPQYLRYDEYPFIFLTLMLSLQASYAAPLILLAQNRQVDRDRVTYAEDRAHNERLHANGEYLAREISAIRSALGDVATREFLRAELRELIAEIKTDDEKSN